MNTSHNYSSFIQDIEASDIKKTKTKQGEVSPEVLDEASLRELTYTPSPLFFTRGWTESSE